MKDRDLNVSYTGNGTYGRENASAPTGHLFQIPKREWVGLTEDEAIELLPVGDWEIEPTLDFAKAIEAKLKEKNT